MTDVFNEATEKFVRQNRYEDVRKLALRKPPQDVDMRMALQQIEGWQVARRKLPSWAELEGLWFPPRLAMEQCSSEQTARYKMELARRLLGMTGCLPGGTMMDLTGGFGIDFSFLAPLFSRAVYMERQSELCRIVRHNFRVLRLQQAVVREVDSSLSPQDWPEVDLCFIDPARRDAAGRKTVAIADCTPDLEILQEDILRKSRFCLVKLSPMLDIQAALRVLKGVSEVHAVSVQGECKELLWVMTREESPRLIFHCADIRPHGCVDFTFAATDEEQAACAYATSLKQYLYEPNASVLKCGGYKCVAERYGLCKLHPNSHLYTSDQFQEDFPGRGFRIECVVGFGKKELKEMLRDVHQGNLSVRNFPSSVAELRKRLRLKEGGDAYFFATTLYDGQHVLIRCRKMA